MNSRVARIRRDICAREKCPHLAELKFNDPCAACPENHWGEYERTGCEDGAISVKIDAEWPIALRPFKLLAKPTDKGLGDIIERTLGPVGGDAYKAWYEKIFGKPCGCTERAANLNLLYPL